MTVSQLMAKLAKMPKDATVLLTGDGFYCKVVRHTTGQEGDIVWLTND